MRGTDSTRNRQSRPGRPASRGGRTASESASSLVEKISWRRGVQQSKGLVRAGEQRKGRWCRLRPEQEQEEGRKEGWWAVGGGRIDGQTAGRHHLLVLVLFASIVEAGEGEGEEERVELHLELGRGCVAR
jgi:hypothetical protein